MKNILLIEPNTVLATLYQRALQQVGYTVTHVTGAQQGIDAADATMPDLVVLELQLSRHSGIEFLHEFRSYPEWSHIPVVLHTNTAPNRIVEKPLKRDLGVAAILYKPKTTLEMLAQTIERQLQTR